MKHLLQVALVVVAVAVVPATARAGQFPLIQLEPLLTSLAVAHTASKPHASQPHKSPSHSTPHHASTPKVTPQVSKPATSTKPTTTKPTTTTVAGKGSSTTNNSTKITSTTRNYYPRSTTQNAFGSGFSYSTGHSYRSSRYSQRRHHQNIVRGIVTTKTGTGANGSVQVKVLRKSASRFRNPNGAAAGAGAVAGAGGVAGAGVAGGNSTSVHTYQVSNQTRYAHAINARGGMRASSFKELEPGKPVMILTPKAGNHHAVAIEIWPHTKP